jgi:hypothetical protein
MDFDTFYFQTARHTKALTVNRKTLPFCLIVQTKLPLGTQIENFSVIEQLCAEGNLACSKICNFVTIISQHSV